MGVHILTNYTVDFTLIDYTLKVLNNLIVQANEQSNELDNNLRGFLGLSSILLQQFEDFISLFKKHRMYSVGSIGRSICETVIELQFMTSNVKHFEQRARRFAFSSYQTTVSLSNSDAYLLLIKLGLLSDSTTKNLSILTSNGSDYFNSSRSNYYESFCGTPIYSSSIKFLYFDHQYPNSKLKNYPIDTAPWFDETGKLRVNCHPKRNNYGFGGIGKLLKNVLHDNDFYKNVYAPLCKFVHPSSYDQMIYRDLDMQSLLFGRGYFSFDWIDELFRRLVYVIYSFSLLKINQCDDIIEKFKSDCLSVYGSQPENLIFSVRSY